MLSADKKTRLLTQFISMQYSSVARVASDNLCIREDSVYHWLQKTPNEKKSLYGMSNSSNSRVLSSLFHLLPFTWILTIGIHGNFACFFVVRLFFFSKIKF